MTIALRTIRIGLVEDHHLVRDGLRMLLSREPDFLVVGEAESRDAAFDLLEEAQPDVLLLDLSLGDQDAVPIIGAIRSRFPKVRILVLTMHRDPETVRQSLIAGATGYLLKGAYATELIAAVRAVARGERYLHSAITAGVVDDSLRWVQSNGRLTSREREILSLFAAGYGPAVIGRSLGISANTVRRHLANLAAKLELRGRAALTEYAIEHGVVRRGA
jgi:two-component system, NarL family, response regulator NreC